MRKRRCPRLVGVTETLTELGVLIERARAELRISAREAARRAGISPTRWRQVVTGEQIKNGRPVAVNPTARTVVAMALAVVADPADALTAAGLSVPADLALLVGDVQRETSGQRAGSGAPTAVELTADEQRRLTDEIARIEGMRLPAASRLAMLEALIRLWEQHAVEREREAG